MIKVDCHLAILCAWSFVDILEKLEARPAAHLLKRMAARFEVVNRTSRPPMQRCLSALHIA